MNVVTEESALLQDTLPVIRSLPPVRPAIIHLDSLSHREFDQIYESEALWPSELSRYRALRVAFALVVLLTIRDQKLHDKSLLANPWDQWSYETTTQKQLKSINECIEQVWVHSFLDAYCSSSDIEAVLWSVFQIDQGSQKTVRVIDFLLTADAPKELLSHRVISSNLWNRWHQGPVLDHSRSRHYLTSRYDSQCTPRSAHAVDLVIHLAFLFLLISYTLDPPRAVIFAKPLEYIDDREIFLLVSCVSLILSSWSTSSIPFIITLFAFLMRLPSVPLPGHFSFSLLLISIFLLLVHLHLPSAPSPLFILPLERSLPFAVFLCSKVLDSAIRVLLFFLPILALSVYLLSFSLADTFLQLQTGSTFVIPAPMEARGAFLALFIGVAIILLMLLLNLSIISTVPSSRSISSWDKYPAPSGDLARVTFYRTIVKYSKPYYFPPPFNIIHFILVSIPSFGLRVFGIPHSFMLKFERLLWRTTVGPFFALARLLLVPLP